jgi:hypothetical protein
MIRGQDHDQGHGLTTALTHHYEKLMRKGERKARLGFPAAFLSPPPLTKPPYRNFLVTNWKDFEVGGE